MKPITELQIKQLLLDDGIPSNLVGFEYLTTVISRYGNGRTLLKDIFQEISEEENVSISSVISAVRTVVLKSQSLLSQSARCTTVRPSTATFVSYCKLKLTMNNIEGLK